MEQPEMPYPNLSGKHAYDALVTPQELHASLRAEDAFSDLSERAGVRGAILCYQGRIPDRVATAADAMRIRGVPGEPFLVDGGREGGQIAVCGRFGIGAPAATMVLEALIALGVRRVVSIGTAGCLQRGVVIGDLVLCTEAVRDEGVSHHYLPPDTPARPTPALTEMLRAALMAGRGAGSGSGSDVETALHAGPTWTIDAPFRETVEEARHYQALGVETVEMEAAALFAVAAHRGVEIASAFVVSDSLAELVWTPRFHDPAVDRGLDALYAAARGALLGEA